MLCGAWTDLDLVTECCSGIALDDLVARTEEAIDVASELLYLLTGRQFAGEQQVAIRPHDDSICMGRRLSVFAVGDWESMDPETDPVMWTCGCARNTLLDLGYANVTTIDEVVIDGAVLDDSNYELLDGRFLQRMAGPSPDYDNPGWPRHQHIDRALSEPGTWAVTFKHGAALPAGAVRAATALACELVKAYARSEDCQLPGRVTSVNRQGISMTLIDPTALSEGLTGVYEADLFIKAVNPTGARGGALVWSPDLDPVPR